MSDEHSDLPARGETLRRATGRVLPVDEHGRVLLVHGWEPDHPEAAAWFTIGGGVEAGENTRAAAARELREETGIVLDEAALGEPFVRDEVSFTYAGRTLVNEQEIYAVRIPAATPIDLSGLDADEAANCDACAWVTVADLVSGAAPAASGADLAAYAKLAIGELNARERR